uniref:Uncharacterized protein n=2 Tax=Palpitomonas bilix TaxID=652834 RepID=A0A7S3D7M4_9EUKA|mmetsp:Transcript_25647/g.64445  ORF Transcript_25647/g.64445 Transcript_25647/m.64445 type:complete len:1891 (+) Transcript_25647:367-6039(+)
MKTTMEDPPRGGAESPSSDGAAGGRAGSKTGKKKHLVCVRDRSLGIFTEKNSCRIALNKVVNWKWFDRAVLLLILSNCVFLALSDPLCEGHADLAGTGHPCENKTYSACNGTCFCSLSELTSWTNAAGERVDTCNPFCSEWMSTRPEHICDQGIGRVIQTSELVYQILFTVEMLLKILAKGFILHKGAYLRDGWNWIDFAVVVVGWLTYIPGVGNFTALRTIRVLRPLRTMSRIPGMKPVISALIMAVQPLLDVLFLFLFVVLIFGIFAIQLFPGTFRGRCFYSEGPLAGLPSEPEAEGTAICSLDQGGRVCPMKNGYQTHCSMFKNGFSIDDVSVETIIGEYRRYHGESSGNTLDMEVLSNPNAANFGGHINFDNFGFAVLAIFQSISLEGWTEIMYSLQDGWSSVGATVYFVMMIVLGAMFTINLALAVIADTYSEQAETEREERSHMVEKPDSQKVGLMKVLVVFKRKMKGKKNDSNAAPSKETCWGRFRTGIRFFVLSKGFTGTIMALIVINTIFLSMEFYDHASFTNNSVLEMQLNNITFQNATEVEAFLTARKGAISGMPLVYATVLETVNIVLTIVFFLEMMLKLLGLGFRGYVHDTFNIFDGIIVILSMIELIVTNTGSQASDASAGIIPLFRAFRLFRVFKLARSWKGLSAILKSISFSIRSVAPLLIVLIVFIFIFSLLGMQLYGGSFPYSDPEERSNFDTFFPSKYGFGGVITIFQMLTGENWNSVMYSGMSANGVFDFIYFLLVVVLGIYIVMNLFLAILLEGFSDTSSTDSMNKSVISNPEARLAAENDLPRVHPVQDSPTQLNINEWQETLKKEVKARAEKLKQSGKKVLPIRDDGEEEDESEEKEESEGEEEGGQANARSSDEKNANTTNDEERKVVLSRNNNESLTIASVTGSNISEVSGSESAANGEKLPPLKRKKKPKMKVGDGAIQTTIEEGIEMADMHKPNVPRLNLPNRDGSGDEKGEEEGGSDGEPQRFRARKSHDRPLGLRDKWTKEGFGDEDDKETVVAEQGSTARRRLRQLCTNDMSFFIFSSRNPFRRFLKRTVESKVFETIILVSIVVSSLLLAIENPSDYVEVIGPSGNAEVVDCADENNTASCGLCCGPNSTLGEYFEGANVVFIAIFIMEMVLKMISYGFVGHKNAYFRDPWNVLDSLIVVVGVIALVEPDVSALRALRTFRALRPLRLINRNPGLKIAVICLFKSIPAIANVFAVCLLFYLVFAILAVQLFAGKLRRCYASSDTTQYFEHIEVGGEVVNIRTSFDCARVGGVWENPRYHRGFDNVFDAILTLFEVSTFEGWLVVMANTMDGVGAGLNPQINFDPMAAFFYVIFAVVGGFFVLNLFTGVVIDNYNRIKETHDGAAFLTNEQKEWVNAMRLMLRSRPRPMLKTPKSAFRRFIFRIVTRPAFDYTILAMILLNVALLGTSTVFRPNIQAFIVVALGYFFSGVFILEALLKIIALGPKQYFRDGWNTFDFIIVLGSLPGLVPELRDVRAGSVLRIFRIARLFRIVRSAKGLRRLFETLLFSLPSLANIGGLLLLVFVVFAILGVNFFWNVKHGDMVTDYANFQTFGVAMLTLFRMTTGEDWNGIMHDCMRGQCRVIEPKNPEGCGHGALGVTFFVIFNVLGNFILLNLFIAVIMDNFAEARKNDEANLSKEKLTNFADTWALFDPEANGWIEWRVVITFVKKLDTPLGVGEGASWKEVRSLLLNIHIPNHNGRVNYLECFHALLLRIVGDELPNSEAAKKLERERQLKFLQISNKSGGALGSVGLDLAASQVQAVYAGFRTRREVERLRKIRQEQMDAKKEAEREEMSVRSGPALVVEKEGEAPASAAPALAPPSTAASGADKGEGGEARPPTGGSSARLPGSARVVTPASDV